MKFEDIAFGKHKNVFLVPRNYEDVFVSDVLHTLGFDNYGLPSDKNLLISLGFVKNEYGVYTNKVFSIFPYWWGDCNCGAFEKNELVCTENCKTQFANFVHHPTGFAISWYKYALRGAYSNIPFSIELLHQFSSDAKHF